MKFQALKYIKQKIGLQLIFFSLFKRMIDIGLLKTESGVQQISNSLNRRYLEDQISDKLSELAQTRSALTQQLEKLQSKRNASSKQLGVFKSKGDEAGFQELQSSIQGIGGEIKEAKLDLEKTEALFNELLLTLPNFLQDDVPAGEDETGNQTIRQHLSPDSIPQAAPHYDIGESSGHIDFARGVKISGSRFYVYNSQIAKLERLLINFMLNTHIENGYQERLVPFLVKDQCMVGTGQFPKFQGEYYRVQEDNMTLIPTAEVPLTNLYSDEIIDSSELPIQLTAATPCFRREAGSAGKDTRGLIRVHQFNKVELVIFCTPEKSEEMHQQLVQNVEEVLKRLNICYRVQLLCSGDTSHQSSKTYDLEVWFPGLQRWVEISSCSNFLDFQSRRAKIRYKDGNGKNRFLHTLNGSGVAAGRLLAALMEYHQKDDDIDFDTIEAMLSP